MSGYRRHLGERPDLQTRRTHLDEIMGAPQRSNVDDSFRPQDIELHQVNQRRAAGQVLRLRVYLTLARARSETRGLRQVIGAFEDEGAHQVRSLSRACLIAATIFGYAAHRHRLPLMYSWMSASVFAWPSRTHATADMI